MRAIAPIVMLLAAAGFFGWWVHRFYPIQQWLFWRYAGYWVACAFWASACIAAGHTTIRRVAKTTLPLLEHLSSSFAVGAFEFFVLMNVVGHLQLFEPWMFFALPAAMLAAGARDSVRTLRRLGRHLGWARARSVAAPRPWWWWPAVLYGLYGMLLVYVLILTPDNVQFDSRWKHIALAEEFASYGGLRRFPEGWTVATYPHLPSFVYGWAFLAPGVKLFDKVELAAHMEFTTFLCTLVATPAMVRLLVPRVRAHLSWVVRFCFPGFFLYDSSLSTGADHLGAFFVLPAFAMLVRFLRRLEWRYAVLMALPLCGVGMTKYTCMTMTWPLFGGAVAARAGWALWQRLRHEEPSALARNWLVGPATALLSLLAFTSVHWVKNWIWYGDPTYPTLYKHLALDPWTQDAAEMFEWGYKEHQFWRPERNLKGVLESLGATFSFSFVPNDYGNYHGKVPTFGSLFTLLLACLPFLRRPGRIAGLALMAHASIFIWYWTHHQDRYLQAILPWLAATTAAIIACLWRDGELTGAAGRWLLGVRRAMLAGLVSLQVIWGGDVWFYPTHAMAKSPQKKVLDLFASNTHRGNPEARFQLYSPWTDVAKLLPDGARAMLHDNHVHAGIDASTVNDWVGWQYGISYVRIGSPAALYDEYRRMGVTHLVWENLRSVGWDAIGGDLLFFEFAYRHTVDRKSARSVFVSRMPDERPDDSKRNARVAFLACDQQNYATGLYELADLATPVFGPNRLAYPAPRETGKVEHLLARASFAVVDPSCKSFASHAGLADFELVAHRRRIHAPRGKKTLDLYLRKTGRVAVPAEPPSDEDSASDDAPDQQGRPEDDDAR